MHKVLGLDLSLTGAGIVGLKGCALDWQLTLNKTVKTKADEDLYERCSTVAGEVLDHIGKDVTIVMEDYAVGKFAGSAIKGITLGAIVRYFLRQHRQSYWLVSPTGVKSFVADNGSAKKELMLLSVYKRWGFDTTDNNQADAYGLARMGACLADNSADRTKSQAKALQKCIFVDNET